MNYEYVLIQRVNISPMPRYHWVLVPIKLIDKWSFSNKIQNKLLHINDIILLFFHLKFKFKLDLRLLFFIAKTHACFNLFSIKFKSIHTHTNAQHVWAPRKNEFQFNDESICWSFYETNFII